MDDNCIFCKIARKEIPAKIVYEDEYFMGIMDISPLNLGHVQVIPKKHFRWTWDVPNFGEYWEAAKKVAMAQMKGLNAKMVEFLTHGTDVEHAHIWVVPIYRDEVFIDVDNRKKFSESEMENAAQMIKENIKQ